MLKKVQLEGYIVVPEADIGRVLMELPNHIRLTLAEKGCMAFAVTRRINEPNYFDVYEVFESEASFEAHQKRVQESAWGEVTKSVERNYSITCEQNCKQN